MDSVFIILPDSIQSASLVLDTAADYSLRPIPYQAVEAVEEPAWHSGLEPEPREMLPGNRSGFVLVVALLLVLVLFSFSSLKAMLRFNVDELFTIRKGRDNVFDERPGAFHLLQWMLAVVFILCGGFFLACFSAPAASAEAIGICVGLVACYYLFDLAAYSAVGYTFSTDEGRREWVRGFSASVSLLSVGLALPALVVAFYPGATFAMLSFCFVLFVLTKLLFILKGFRIFFVNFFSLLYFILYLCTLEIIPIILVYKCSVVLLI